MNQLLNPETWFQVVEWWPVPAAWPERYRDIKIPKKALIGVAENVLDRIPFNIPAPPEDITKVLYWNLPKEDQYWRRDPNLMCEEWSSDEELLNEIAAERFSYEKVINGKKTIIVNTNWWRNPDNMTPRMLEDFEREWDRRHNGIWFFNNGELTYLTGQHYLFLQHGILEGGERPIYKDRNMMDFYAMRAGQDSASCDGVITPKHRRGNLTSISCVVGVDNTTRTRGANMAILSNGKGNAELAYQEKILPFWHGLPPFFRPFSRSASEGKAGIEMYPASKMGASKKIRFKEDDPLYSSIRPYANGDGKNEPLDSKKYHVVIRDESGKEDLLSVLAQWIIIRKCLKLPDGSRGFAIYPSTRSDLKKHANEFELLCNQSRRSLMFQSLVRETPSGMWYYFIPCFVGHTEIQFTGKYGESIVTKPTPEQREWLLANRVPNNEESQEKWRTIYDLGGAYEYELALELNRANNQEERRMMPFTEDDVFAVASSDAQFPLEKINPLIKELKTPFQGTKTLAEVLTIRGNLHWVSHFKGDVYFKPDEKGKFLFNRAYLPVEYGPAGWNIPDGKAAEQWGGEVAMRLGIRANDVVRYDPRFGVDEKVGKIKPSDRSWINISLDPQKVGHVEGQETKGLSQASAHAFYPYNPLIDGQWTNKEDAIEGYFEEWDSHAYVLEYLIFPKGAAIVQEDMLMLCIFLNAKILFERQVGGLEEYFRIHGASDFLLDDKPWKSPSSNTPIRKGYHQDVNYQGIILNRLLAYCDKHLYAKRMPFLRTLTQFALFKADQFTKFDAVVSSGTNLMAWSPNDLMDKKKYAKLQAEEKEKDWRDNPYDLGHMIEDQ